jgi:hypothetical protein
MRPNKKKSSNAQRQALIARANVIFGSVETLNAQFKKLGLGEVENIDLAIRKIASLWLNIVDFVNGKLKPFENKYKLINYTRHTNKYFRKDEAKANGLSQLLVKMSF